MGAVVVVVLGVMWDGSREWSVAAVMDDGWLEGRSVGRKLGVPSFLPCFAASSHCCAAAAREIQNAEGWYRIQFNRSTSRWHTLLSVNGMRIHASTPSTPG